jgi:hypothetical protein
MKEALSSSETRFLQEPHGVTSQKMLIFIVTAVKTSSLTFWTNFVTTFSEASPGLPNIYLPTKLYGVTLQKDVILIFVGVRASSIGKESIELITKI